MALSAFAIVWTALGLYAVLAGADFGVGILVLVGRLGRSGAAVERDCLAYFSRVWEVHGLLLVFFLTGLFVAFPSALGLLGDTLVTPVLFALALFVVRAMAYLLLHGRVAPGPAAPVVIFGLASAGVALLLGYAAAAPASGAITGHHLPASYFTSPVGLAAIPLALAASAHLAAVALCVHARGPSRDWFRRVAMVGGAAALLAAGGLTVAILEHATYTRGRLLGVHGAPMVAAGCLLLLALLALARRRFRLAALATVAGYLTGFLGGAFAQLPYVVYPELKLSAAASPSSTLSAFLIAAAVGAPALIAAVGVLYSVVLRWDAAVGDGSHP
jgi:cytochrome bd ubiquinol oxidase subunit II